MILADSTFLIDTLRKKSDIKSFLLKYPDEVLFTTEFNVFELYLGLFSSKILEKEADLRKKRLLRLEELLLKFQILQFGRKESIKSAKILGSLNRLGKSIEFRDGIIAGIALANGITKILTKNVDHFVRFENLQVVTY